MSDRSKYSLNGVYRCRNFTRQVENDNFMPFSIGYVSGFNWNIQCGKQIRNDKTFVYPVIFNRLKPKTQVRAYFKILKKDGSSAYEREFGHTYLESNEGCKGMDMNIEYLLDEDNGFLKKRALYIEYGFQVESVEGEDGIWMFNFLDKFFEWQTKDYMFEFTLRRQRTVFSHKQIIKLHSTTIDTSKNSVWAPIFFYSNTFFMCAQITHGVRLQLDAVDYRNVARVAFHFGFSNTVKYCEEQLIVMEPSLNIFFFEMADRFNMRCYLIHLLKQIETKKQLIKILKGLDFEEMSSESMKAIVTKIFSL